MIEDKFTLKQQASESVLLTVCRECGHTFDVDTNIKTPWNCKYDHIRHAMTVVCPSCFAEATTTERESQILVLTASTDALREKIEKYTSKNKLRFKVLSIDQVNESMHMECQMCGYEFMADPRKRENIEWRGNVFIITCPLCSNKDQMTPERAGEQHTVVLDIAQYEQLMSMLDKLKGEGDGAGSIQTSL